MKSILIIVSSFFLVCHSLTAQNNWRESEYTQIDSLDIREIKIENNLLNNFLINYIREKENNIPIFKEGYGYVKINNIEFKNTSNFIEFNDTLNIEKWAKDTLVSLSIAITSLALNNDSDIHNEYPSYYTFINNKIILLYDKILDLYTNKGKNISSKSKYRIQKLLYPFLNLSLKEDFVFSDLTSTKFKLSTEQRKHMSTDEVLKKASFTLYHEDTVYILRNGDILLKNK